MSRSQIEMTRRVKMAQRDLDGAIYWRNLWKKSLSGGDKTLLRGCRELMRDYALNYRRVLRYR